MMQARLSIIGYDLPFRYERGFFGLHTAAAVVLFKFESRTGSITPIYNQEIADKLEQAFASWGTNERYWRNIGAWRDKSKTRIYSRDNQYYPVPNYLTTMSIKDILARAIYAESASNPDGCPPVARTIQNRAKHGYPSMGETIQTVFANQTEYLRKLAGVVYHPQQFTGISNGSSNACMPLRGTSAWREAVDLAERLVSDNVINVTYDGVTMTNEHKHMFKNYGKSKDEFATQHNAILSTVLYAAGNGFFCQ